MNAMLRNNPYGYLLRFENQNVSVRKKDKGVVQGFIEVVDDDDTFDRAEPSITLWHGGTTELIFAGDIEDIEVDTN